MQRESEFATKITNNTAKTKNPITITTVALTAVAILLLLSETTTAADEQEQE
jgi:hypothetical protein